MVIGFMRGNFKVLTHFCGNSVVTKVVRICQDVEVQGVVIRPGLTAKMTQRRRIATELGASASVRFIAVVRKKQVAARSVEVWVDFHSECENDRPKWFQGLVEADSLLQGAYVSRLPSLGAFSRDSG